MRDDVIISHRGARYEIGRGPGCYAIWPAGAAHLQPIEWWPETEAGWQDAWARFTDIESRRSITEVQPVAAPAGPGPAGTLAAPSASADVTVADAQFPGATPAGTTVPGTTTPGTTAPGAAGPGTAIPGPAGPGAAIPGPAGPGGAELGPGHRAIPACAAAGLADTTLPPPGSRSAGQVGRGGPARFAGQAARFARGGPRAMAAAGVLAVGVLLGLPGLFPRCFRSFSLASGSS
ncbi:MAG: hypothetical protein ACR2FU_18480 [Streptosporangiaceae bacterium]